MEGETNILKKRHTAKETIDCRLSQIQNTEIYFPKMEYNGPSTKWIPHTGGCFPERSKQASAPKVQLVQVIFTDSSN